MVLVKNLKIWHVLSLRKVFKENVFDDILFNKKGPLDNKNINFQKSRNSIFPKGLVHGLWTNLLRKKQFFARFKIYVFLV